MICALQIHFSVAKVGLDLNVFVGNGLVAMYGKCDRLVEARRVLDEMPGEAVDLFLQMEDCKVQPDSLTIASVLPACGDLSALLLGKQCKGIKTTSN